MYTPPKSKLDIALDIAIEIAKTVALFFGLAAVILAIFTSQPT